jgi:hypothetical protein
MAIQFMTSSVKFHSANPVTIGIVGDIGKLTEWLLWQPNWRTDSEGQRYLATTANVQRGMDHRHTNRYNDTALEIHLVC